MNIEKSKITEINRLHGEIEQALRQSLSNAIQIGQQLDEVKESLPHGEFTDFITDNLSFYIRTAQRYLKLYQNRDRLSEATDLKSAYRMLSAKNDTVSHSPVDEILEYLKSLGVESLIPNEGEAIRLFSQKPYDPAMSEGFDILEIKHGIGPGYLNPTIYRVGTGKSDGYGYEIYNKRGGIKFDDTKHLIRFYSRMFNFMEVDGHTAN